MLSIHDMCVCPLSISHMIYLVISLGSTNLSLFINILSNKRVTVKSILKEHTHTLGSVNKGQMNLNEMMVF